MIPPEALRLRFFRDFADFLGALYDIFHKFLWDILIFL